MPLKDQQQLIAMTERHLTTFKQLGSVSKDAVIRDLLFLNVRSKEEFISRD
jgi:hypothetical protein